MITQLRDKAIIYNHLKKDIALFAYHIGDLDEFFFGQDIEELLDGLDFIFGLELVDDLRRLEKVGKTMILAQVGLGHGGTILA